jgi:putative metallohydrolase (TIGR04338 family)
VGDVNRSDRVKGSDGNAPNRAQTPVDAGQGGSERDTSGFHGQTIPKVRDGQRAKVYRAEEAWAARLDAARQGARFARVGGSSVLLPGERRFGDLTGATAYANALLAQPSVVHAVGRLPSPALRPRRGGKAAHWESPGVIAVHVPEHGEPWALRESVLLHELGHHVGHLTGRTANHASPFPALVLLLVEAALGEQAAFALRVDYGEQGVTVGEP